MWWNNYIDNKGSITLTVDKAIDIQIPWRYKKLCFTTL